MHLLEALIAGVPVPQSSPRCVAANKRMDSVAHLERIANGSKRLVRIRLSCQAQVDILGGSLHIAISQLVP